MTDEITFYDDIEGYCGSLSYVAGSKATLHVSTKLERYDVVVERQGAETTRVFSARDLPGSFTPAPIDADANGCRWPVSIEIPIGEAWASGFYLVTLVGHGGAPGRDTAHAGFVVRSDRPRHKALWVLATNTWHAYNTWGGMSLYTGGTQVAYGRPFARGMLWRQEVERDDRKARPTRWGEEPDIDGDHFQAYRFEHGYSAAIGSSGWHQYERRFARWAEDEGYTFDYAVSSDLERDPTIAEGYDVILGVGHDEYWSAGQRRAIEDHVRRGGRYVSMSGNTMFWQVRVESAAVGNDPDETAGGDSANTMVCYKYAAHRDDPVLATEPELMSGMWADPIVGRPEAALLGGGSAWGLYSRFGLATPRGSGAFTVYRNDHWIFAGTDLRYGDLLGARDGVVGYETLGCRIQFDEYMLPIRCGGDATPDDTEILAFTPASNCGVGEYPKSIAALSDQGDLEFVAERLHGDTSVESLNRVRHGNAVIVVTRPFPAPSSTDRQGEVVTIGSTDWVFGLDTDEAVAQVTRNALAGSPGSI